MLNRVTGVHLGEIAKSSDVIWARFSASVGSRRAGAAQDKIRGTKCPSSVYLALFARATNIARTVEHRDGRWKIWRTDTWKWTSSGCSRRSIRPRSLASVILETEFSTGVKWCANATICATRDFGRTRERKRERDEFPHLRCLRLESELRGAGSAVRNNGRVAWRITWCVRSQSVNQSRVHVDGCLERESGRPEDRCLAE